MAQNDSAVNNFGGKTWELSPYELHRQPQEVITDHSEIAVSPRSLHSELMCPICLDLLKNTMTTKECLHRFCQECIITALRSGNKECPTCRKKLISKRSLRADPNFDMLISKIYPNRDEYDAQQERVMNSVNRHFAHNIEETLRMQAMNRNSRNRKSNVNDENDLFKKMKNSSSEGFNGSNNVNNLNNGDSGPTFHDNNVPEIELIVKPLPQVDRKDPSLNQTRFIKTTTTATINHIAKYLGIRYNFESSEVNEPSSATASSTTLDHYQNNNHQNSNNNNNNEDSKENHSTFPFTMYIAGGPGQYNPLQGSQTLAQINEHYWTVNRPLELFYAYKVNTTS